MSAKPNTHSPYATTVRHDRHRQRPDDLSRKSSTVVASTVDPADPPDPPDDAARPRKMAARENFAACYMELCKQRRIRPLPVIRTTLPHSLDLTTDRVKMDDWGPILNALSLDRTLKSVCIRSRYQCRKPLEEINSEDKARSMSLKRKEPVVLTRYLLEWLAQSVAQCARNSRALTCLELEGVPFPADCLAALCVGLAGATSVRHLGLRRCCIGDAGCELVCRTVADLRNLRSLDLSECQLSENCAGSLAAALSRQKLTLYHETWKESLRYREPDLDAMPGLRRLTLNGNPRLGDRAVSRLVEAVRDSLWLKALDLQNCGLTDAAGHEIVQLLEQNATLAIVDVRVNWNLSEETAAEIFRRLEANRVNATNNGKSVYAWMSLPRRDQRNAVSAGSTRKNRYEDANAGAEIVSKARPQSAKPFSGPAARTAAIYNGRCARNGYNNNSVTNNNNNNKNNNKVSRVDEKATRQPKISLRLDIPRVESAVGTKVTQPGELSNDREIDSDVVASEEDKETDKSAARGGENEEDEDFTARAEQRAESATEVSRILRELSEARMEQDRLIEETKRTDELLAEERARRENAESKLRRMKENLADLEAALRKKERETRGFLLVSQRSLDDIAATFERLLEMLESSARNEDEAAASPASRTDEYSMATADIRTRVAHLIRKSKSESHGRRGFRVEREETSVIEASKPGNAAKIFARSEGDVTCPVAAILQPIRLERNIGDSPDVVSTRARAELATYREASYKDDYNKMADSRLTCERARAIFARVVNGDAILHIRGAHGS